MFTGISGSYTVAQAAISASSLGLHAGLALRRPGGVLRRRRHLLTHCSPPLVLAAPRSARAMARSRTSRATDIHARPPAAAAAPAPRPRIAIRASVVPVRAIARNFSASAFASSSERPFTASAIRSAEASLIAQPRASNPVSAMRPSASRTHPDLHAVAAHRVVAVRGDVERPQPPRMPRPAAVVDDHFLVEIEQIVEHHAEKLPHPRQRRRPANRSRHASCRCRSWRARCSQTPRRCISGSAQ